MGIISFVATIYEQLRLAIERSERSRYSIAKEAGVAEAQLSQFMSGSKGLSIEALERLVAVLELEVVIRPKSRQKGQKS